MAIIVLMVLSCGGYIYMKLNASRILIFSCICFFNSLICFLLNYFFFKRQFIDILPSESIISFIVQKIPDLVSFLMYFLLVVGVFMLIAGISKLIISKRTKKQNTEHSDL